MVSVIQFHNTKSAISQTLWKKFQWLKEKIQIVLRPCVKRLCKKLELADHIAMLKQDSPNDHDYQPGSTKEPFPTEDKLI